ncbi:FUSC family protein [Streptococcus pluranimalium]|uniref:FUSC family protein n=1 Tax=Streptococcus pluranimalium TaxID=82348 RepID=UPI0039FD09E4
MPFYFDPKKFRLGMRTVKTGLSVFIVLLLYKFIDWGGLQIAALSAVFSLREDFGKSVHFGSSRIFGNAIGGCYALLFFILKDVFAHQFWVTLLLIPIFTVLTIMTNVSFNNTPGVISGVATMLIISLSVPAGDSILYALTRIFETFIGVFVAILVNTDLNKLRKWLRQLKS